MKTRTLAPNTSPAVAAPALSPRDMKVILAQVYLLTVLEELTDLRRTIRLQGLALAELRQKTSLPPAVVTELLATVQRRDRKFARRLGKLQTNVNKASRLLIPPDGKPVPAQ